MKKIALYGAGGHCYAIIELIRSLEDYEPKVIFDDHSNDKKILEVPIENDIQLLSNYDRLCISIGNNRIRKTIAESLTAEFPTFIHNSSVLYPSASVGEGSTILPLAVVDADVHIGNHCIINNHATISHNVRIADYVHIAIQASIAGGVTIGEGTLIGAGSIILPGVSIGRWSVIGAGSVVTKNVADHSVVYGNPASFIRANHKQDSKH